MADKIKVIVIGTGNVAGIAIRCLKGREDMELVGVWAHEQTAGHLIGTDSGLLDLDEPNGVIITGDIEELYALKPDAASTASGMPTCSRTASTWCPRPSRACSGPSAIPTARLSRSSRLPPSRATHPCI